MTAATSPLSAIPHILGRPDTSPLPRETATPNPVLPPYGGTPCITRVSPPDHPARAQLPSRLPLAIFSPLRAGGVQLERSITVLSRLSLPTGSAVGCEAVRALDLFPLSLRKRAG
jgi:hypothetical protein